MNPIGLLEFTLFSIVVLSPNITKSPEVIGATIQAVASIFGVVIAFVLQEWRINQERKKTSRVIQENNNLNERFLENGRTLKELQERYLKELQERPEVVANPKLKNDLSEATKLIEHLIVETGKTPGAYENAYFWLKKERDNLIRNAINDVFEKYPDLRKPGNCLASKEQRERFKLSLEDRLASAVIYLKNKAPLKLREGWTPRIKEFTAYREAYDSIRRQVRFVIENGSSSLSRSGADMLQKSIDCLDDEEISN